MNRLFALRWRLPFYRRLALWFARNTPSCSQMARLSSASLERSLTVRERLLRLAHFLACDWCLRYARQLRFLRTAAHSLAHRDASESGHVPPHPLKPEARERLKRRLAQEPPSSASGAP